MARYFDGNATNFLDQSSAATNSTTITVAGWAYLSNTGSPYYDHFYIKNGPGTSYHGLVTGEGLTSLYCFSGDDSSNFGNSVGTGLSYSAWQHVGGVYNGTSSRTAYVNGTAATADTTTVTPSTFTRMSMAQNGAATSQYSYAEWAIWDAALTSAEMASLAAGFSPLMIRPGSLVAYWPIYGKVSGEPDYVGGFNWSLTGTDASSAHPRMFKSSPAANVLGITAASKAMPIFSRTPRFIRRAA